jgi:hypothetical protein
VVAEVHLSIAMHLLARGPASGLKRICSHANALHECRATISEVKWARGKMHAAFLSRENSAGHVSTDDACFSVCASLCLPVAPFISRQHYSRLELMPVVSTALGAEMAAADVRFSGL